jgi:hypothetical protein
MSLRSIADVLVTITAVVALTPSIHNYRLQKKEKIPSLKVSSDARTKRELPFMYTRVG